MFGIFSLIDNIPKIHSIETEKTSAVEALKRQVETITKTEIPLDKITLTTFDSYPALTSLKISDEMYEIYRHSIEETIKKGWIWNGRPKQKIVSEKIGILQIIDAPKTVEAESFQEQPKIETSVEYETENNNLEKRTNLMQFESMFLPFFDEIRQEDQDRFSIDLEQPRPMHITQRGTRAKRRLPYTTRFGNRF